MFKTIFSFLIISSLFLTACSALLPPPTATPEPTATPLPTNTPTLTPLPTSTATSLPPTVTPTLGLAPNLIPEGTPEKEWEGVQIMPGALAGSEDPKGYRFTIKATAAEIQAFYQRELTKAKWSLITAGVGKTKTILLIFGKNQDVFSVSILPYEDLFIVLLVH